MSDETQTPTGGETTPEAVTPGNPPIAAEVPSQALEGTTPEPAPAPDAEEGPKEEDGLPTEEEIKSQNAIRQLRGLPPLEMDDFVFGRELEKAVAEAKDAVEAIFEKRGMEFGGMFSASPAYAFRVGSTGEEKHRAGVVMISGAYAKKGDDHGKTHACGKFEVFSKQANRLIRDMA